MIYLSAIERTANEAVEDEEDARAKLAKHLTGPHRIEAQDFEAVLTATAQARPWRRVLKLTETKGIPDALLTVRADTIRELIEHSEPQSTSTLTNEGARIEREALRRFLFNTEAFAERIKEDREKEAAAPAEEPAPAPGSARRPTKA